MRDCQQLCGFTCSVKKALFDGFYLYIADIVGGLADFVGKKIEIF